MPRAGKLEIWRTGGADGPIGLCNSRTALDAPFPHLLRGTRRITAHPSEVHLTRNFQNVHPVLKGIVLEKTSRGAASCVFVCRCLSLVSACRVQSCREKFRSKSPWIAR